MHVESFHLWNANNLSWYIIFLMFLRIFKKLSISLIISKDIITCPPNMADVKKTELEVVGHDSECEARIVMCC